MTPYSRPAVPGDVAGPAPAQPNNPAPGLNVMRQVDTVVNNTDPTLKTTDTFGDGETSIAINPTNHNEIVITAFSGCWTTCGSGNNTPLWVSLDGGSTWTKQFTVPIPPSGNGVSGCPCDHVMDYGTSNELFGAFLGNNIYSGATSDPTSLPAWAWWLSGSVAQPADHTPLNSGNSDQPWMLEGPGTSNPSLKNVYVAYDDFGTSPVNMHVSASVNNVPPQFPLVSDQITGNSGLGGINPGHRLAVDPHTGWVYSMYQSCTASCGSNPKTIQFHLNRSTDQGTTWSLNGSSSGIVVATANNTEPTPKFGTVNALLGGINHGAVDPSTGDLYYVYGNQDGSGNQRLAIRRVFSNGSGGVLVGPENFVVSGTVDAALPSIAITSNGTIGVEYYTYNGMVSGFPQFSTWLAVSTNQGASFTTTKMATFLSPATDNGNARQRVFGDYMQMKALDNCFYGSYTGNGAVFGRSVSNNDPIFFKACVPGGAATHDFNGDGVSDIAWFNNGTVAIWLMNGSSVTSVGIPGSATAGWSIVGQRDFNGDGKADLLWYNSGNVAAWFMNGTSISSVTSYGNVGSIWTVAGTGDFNGDGKGDILWTDIFGDVAMWLMNGSSVSTVAILGNVGSNWTVAGTGDFNDDGKTDVLWRDAVGDVAIWLMNGTSVSSVAILGNVPTNWSIVGTGDFDGDGKTDILWRDTAGDLAIWFMNGTSIKSVSLLGNVSPAWSITQTGDYNGDGRSDILWTDASGDIVVWFMNGASASSVASLGTVAPAWQIQGAGAD